MSSPVSGITLVHSDDPNAADSPEAVGSLADRPANNQQPKPFVPSRSHRAAGHCSHSHHFNKDELHMTQEELLREVAAATGEDAATVRRLGFCVLDTNDHWLDEDRPPLVVDWDGVDAERCRRAN
jgi:hypothetical protein